MERIAKTGDKVFIKDTRFKQDKFYTVESALASGSIFVEDDNGKLCHLTRIDFEFVDVAEETATDAVEKTFTHTSTTAPVLRIDTNEEEPTKWIVSVIFCSDGRAVPYQKTYEYYAFGTYQELMNASHVVITKEDHTEIDDLLMDTTLSVARIMNVYPVTQQKFRGKLRYIVDFVDGSAFVQRNMRTQRADELRSNIKKRLEEVAQKAALEKMVAESNDPVAAEMLALLKETEND